MPNLLFPEMEYKVEMSPCRTWRYTHEVQWDDGPCVAFLMFNPSIADEKQLDPTLRKCKGFATRWGYGRMIIINLFAIRGTDPRTPSRAVDPVGPLNDYWTLKAMEQSRELICAWGCGQWMKTPKMLERPDFILGRIRYNFEERILPINCLGRNTDGHPKHPLMLAYTTPRERFEALNG